MQNSATERTVWAYRIFQRNGGNGRAVFVSGQIGWNARGEFDSDNFVGQVDQSLKNIVTVLGEDGRSLQHMTSLT